MNAKDADDGIETLIIKPKDEESPQDCDSQSTEKATEVKLTEVPNKELSQAKTFETLFGAIKSVIRYADGSHTFEYISGNLFSPLHYENIHQRKRRRKKPLGM